MKKEYAMDWMRVVMAFLVIANHTSPLSQFNETADFLLTRVVARIAVPFFFMMTGYFALKEKDEDEKTRRKRINTWLKKNIQLYCAATLIYLPVKLYALQGTWSLKGILKAVLFNGTYYHLWYFPAVILGVILHEQLRKLKPSYSFALCLFAYLFALGGDSYYGFISKCGFQEAYEAYFFLFDTTRNGFLFAPIFLYLGKHMKLQFKKNSALAGFVMSLGMMSLEAILLRNLGEMRNDVMYLFLIPTSIFLFQYILTINKKSDKKIRDLSMLIYLFHPMMILVVRMLARVNGLGVVKENQLILFLLVSVLSVFFSCGLLCFQKKEAPDKSRTWIELAQEALCHNVKQWQGLCKGKTKLMAVIKDEAYGLDSIIVAKELQRCGVHYFAVATLNEAIKLKKAGIKGDILILGATTQLDLLRKYNFIQAVVDFDYAQRLNDLKASIRVHVAVDTGMHRLGIDYRNKEEIEAVYRLPYLKVEGIFSHLAVSDSLKEEDILFTKKCKEHFDEVLDDLKDKRLNAGLTHLQSTYGVLNYPDWNYDLVRIGIGLTGILSNDEAVLQPIDLKPVMKLYSRVQSVKIVPANEAIGYGRTIAFNEERKIAVLGIGYGDGLPRNASGLWVEIKGQKAPIVGRVCMDLCMVDVTGMDVCFNDIALVLDENKIMELIKKENTISNALLVGINRRVVRIKKE